MSNCTTTCKPKLYINTTVDIKISLRQGMKYSWEDASDFQVIFELRDSNPVVSRSFSLLKGHVIVMGGVTLLRIPETNGINVKGTYKVTGRFIDKQGKTRGVTLCPTTLEFE